MYFNNEGIRTTVNNPFSIFVKFEHYINIEELKLILIDKADGSIKDINFEVIDLTNKQEICKTNANSNQYSLSIKVDDPSLLNVGDIIIVNNGDYKITAIDNNTIYLDRGLDNDVAEGIEVYKVNEPSEIGGYILKAIIGYAGNFIIKLEYNDIVAYYPVDVIEILNNNTLRLLTIN